MTERILRYTELAPYIGGWTDAYLRKLEDRRQFPRRFKLAPGGRDVGWLESEVQEWIKERAASREPAEPDRRVPKSGRTWLSAAPPHLSDP